MRALIAASALGAAATAGVVAQAPSVRDGIYTTSQAARGQAVYDKQCVSCHGPMAAIVPEMAALLADHTFRSRWTGRPLGELFELIRDTMPQDAPGSLSAQQSAELVTYILSGNRLPAGDVTLTEDPARLGQIPFEP